MKYNLSAEKLEVSLEIDDSFIEALLGVVRAAAEPARPHTEMPEDTDVEKTSAWEEAKPDLGTFKVDRTSPEYIEWHSFVSMWLQNFDQEGTQPDRTDHIRSLGSMKYSGKLLTYVGACGGLTHAVYDAVKVLSEHNESERLSGLSDEELRSISRHAAENMTQVASLFFSDLSDLLEYHNPLED